MNKEIKTVAILGAGAIGSYVIYGLSDVYKENLWVIAEGERAERLKKDGLIINGEHYPLNVRKPEEAFGADLLVICLKYGSLRESLPAIKRIVAENTTVMSLMNGVDSEDIISEVIPSDQIIHALIRIASQRNGNRITYPPLKENMGISYGIPEKANEGEADNIPEDRLGRLMAVKNCFENSRLLSHEKTDIKEDMWKKFTLNISQNIPQAMLSAGVGIYSESEHAAFISQALKNEVIILAKTQGIDIEIKENVKDPGSRGIPRTARFSTLQDLDAGRPTEIDMFCGTVMRLGARYNIPVPYNTFAYHLIRGLEEKNAGKFDWKE